MKCLLNKLGVRGKITNSQGRETIKDRIHFFLRIIGK